MSEEKIKPVLTGAAETMLQSFYARAKYSRTKNHKFYDAKAIEFVEKIDYDFSKAEKTLAFNMPLMQLCGKGLHNERRSYRQNDSF